DGRLAPDLLRGLVLAHGLVDGVPHAPVAGPLAEADLDDELGPDELDVPKARWQATGERRARGPTGVEQVAQTPGLGEVEAGADLAGVAQATIVVEDADEEGAERPRAAA